MAPLIRLVFLALLLVLTACGQAAAPAATSAPSPAAAATEVAAPTVPPTAAPTSAPSEAAVPTTAPGGGGVDVVDSAGREVMIPGPLTRIVSLAPSTTEILFALGAGSQVVAVDDYSNYPPETEGLPKVGAFGTTNFEQIVALQPELVLAAGITAPETIQRLEELGLAVLVVGAPEASVESVLADIELVGRATGRADQAAALTGELRQRIQAIAETVARAEQKPTVFWELDATDPARPYTVGPGGFVHELITLAGGVNIFGEGDNPYPQVSAEQIVAADPEVIILADAQYGVTVESVGQRPGWGELRAVREDQVHPIDSDLVSRPGPRIAEGLETIARLLHPELF